MAHLDVRGPMARGEEPFAAIMAAVSALSPGEPLELVAPLDPVPLYSLMESGGYGHRTEELGAGDFLVVFTPSEAPIDG